MRAPLLALGLAACGPISDATQILELRVVAAIAEPPAVEIGAPYTLTWTVADPEGRGGAWRAWSCVPEELPPGVTLPDGVEPGCASLEGRLDGETITTPAVALGPLPVWLLACHDDVCDPGALTEADLQDPNPWLQDQPFSGVALGRRFTRLLEAGDEPRSNPVITEAPSLDEPLRREAERPLTFVVPGAERAYGYATVGGFSMTDTDVGRDGDTELTYAAGEEAGAGRIYVVFEDEQGGTALWTSDVEVR